MNLNTQPIRIATLAVLSFGLLTGCGVSGPATHPVNGQLKLVEGDVIPLAGHFIEVARVDDPSVRASGEIKPDGKFELESLLEGKLRRGVLPGKYNVRLILSDDDPQLRRTAAAAVNPKFLKFDSSGLTFDAPATAAVQLQVSRR